MAGKLALRMSWEQTDGSEANGMAVELVCDACKLPPVESAQVAGQADEGISLPRGWVIRRIAGRAFTLCDCCGDIRHFKGGISLYLQENLGVGPYAKCDFGDEPGSGLHRTRVRR